MNEPLRPDQPLTFEELSHRIETSSEGMTQISQVIEMGASMYATSLAQLFDRAGIRQMIPAAWIVYAAMQYAELYFGDITREEWIMVYDRGREVRQLASDHPELIEQLAARYADEEQEHVSAMDKAMREGFGLDLD